MPSFMPVDRVYGLVSFVCVSTHYVCLKVFFQAPLVFLQQLQLFDKTCSKQLHSEDKMSGNLRNTHKRAHTLL